jgi:hypothetical protein
VHELSTCDSAIHIWNSVIKLFMTSPIECLPVEVFDIIASDLDLESYKQLRLASWRLHSLSLSTFAKRYFADLTTTLGSPSLDRLMNITKHAYFSGIATQLSIKLLTYRDYKNLTAIRRVGIYPPPKRFSTVPGIKLVDIDGESTLYHDIFNQNQSSGIILRLSRVLRGLPNLKIVHFRTFHGEPGGWRYGEMPERDQKFRARCFEAVRQSVIISEIQLEEFSMAKRKRTNTLRRGMDLGAANLQLPLPVLLRMRHSFAHLQSLTLSLVAAYNGGSRVPGWENGVSQLVACAPNLRHLTLSLDRSVHISHYSAAVIKSFALSCRLHALESFHLVNCSVQEVELMQFVTAHAELLHALTLHGVRLLSGSWTSFWSSLKSMRDLRCLRFGSLEGTDLIVTLYRTGKGRSKVTLDTDASGRPMNAMLDELISSCHGDADSLANGAG